MVAHLQALRSRFCAKRCRAHILEETSLKEHRSRRGVTPRKGTNSKQRTFFVIGRRPSPQQCDEVPQCSAAQRAILALQVTIEERWEGRVKGQKVIALQPISSGFCKYYNSNQRTTICSGWLRLVDNQTFPSQHIGSSAALWADGME